MIPVFALVLLALVPTGEGGGDESPASGSAMGGQACAAVGDSQRMNGSQWAQVTIEQRIIIRVPMARRGVAAGRLRRERGWDAGDEDVEWEEHKGPKCLPVRSLAAAELTSEHGVDLMLRDRSRMRARLGRECRPEDLYSGFYVQPTSDGNICAGRDQLLTRNGMSCDIDSFRRLVPEKP